MCGIGGITTIHAARHNDAHRRLLFLHHTNLHTGSVRTQQWSTIGRNVKSILRITSRMINGCVEGIEAVILILHLRAIGNHKAKLAKALDDILSSLSKRVEFTKRTAATGGGEIRRFRWHDTSQLDTIPRSFQGCFQLTLSNIDCFAGCGPVPFRQRAQLLHQTREATLRPQPSPLGPIQRSLVRSSIKLGQRLGLQWFNLIQQRHVV